MPNATLISSVDELKQLVASRPQRTITYRTTKEVYDANYAELMSRPERPMTPMTREQNQELADFLDIDLESVERINIGMEECECPQCGRLMTFTDLVNQAVTLGRHNRAFIVDMLFSGREDYFLTVDGENDQEHKMRCLNCGSVDIRMDMTSAYTTHWGPPGYAHCAW